MKALRLLVSCIILSPADGINGSENKQEVTTLPTVRGCTLLHRYDPTTGTCVCKNDCYSGWDCSIIETCYNGGQRYISEGQHSCECPLSYGGDCCSQRVCAPGSTVAADDSCICRYPEYQKGKYCEKVTCLNGGFPHVQLLKCVCLQDGTFGGLFCEVFECLNGGKKLTNTSCTCIDPFYGQHCEKYNCQHGGVFADGGCKCNVIFSGRFCETLNKTVFGLIIGIPLALLFCILWACTRTMKSSREKEKELRRLQQFTRHRSPSNTAFVAEHHNEDSDSDSKGEEERQKETQFSQKHLCQETSSYHSRHPRGSRGSVPVHEIPKDKAEQRVRYERINPKV